MGIIFGLSLMVIFAGVSNAQKIYIPHLTGGHAAWNDWLQVDNTDVTEAYFTLTLYNQGTLVYTKYYNIDALEYMMIDLKTLNKTATCGIINCANERVQFRVSYEYCSEGSVAEFLLGSEIGSTISIFFANWSETTECKGVAIMNAGNQTATITLKAIGQSKILGQTDTTISARSRIFGQHTYWFPGIDSEDLERIVVTSTNSSSLVGITISANQYASQLLFAPSVALSETAAQTLTGLWEGIGLSDWDDLGSPFSMDCVQNGTTISGTLSFNYQHGSVDYPINTSFTGTVTGNQVTISATDTYQEYPFTLQCNTIVIGTGMEGTYTVSINGTQDDSGDLVCILK